MENQPNSPDQDIITLTSELAAKAIPTEAQISQTIAYIQKRLKNPDIDKPINRPVKEGYTEAIRILAEGIEDYTKIVYLTTVQARAIAVLAVDYLKGDESQKMLVNIPLKQ